MNVATAAITSTAKDNTASMLRFFAGAAVVAVCAWLAKASVCPFWAMLRVVATLDSGPCLSIATADICVAAAGMVVANVRPVPGFGRRLDTWSMVSPAPLSMIGRVCVTVACALGPSAVLRTAARSAARSSPVW